MKYLVWIFLLLEVAKAQTPTLQQPATAGGWTNPNSGAYGTIQQGGVFWKSLGIPTGNGTPSGTQKYDLKLSNLYYDSTSGTLYAYNPKTSAWASVGGGSSSPYVTNYYRNNTHDSLIITLSNGVKFGVAYYKLASQFGWRVTTTDGDSSYDPFGGQATGKADTASVAFKQWLAQFVSSDTLIVGNSSDTSQIIVNAILNSPTGSEPDGGLYLVGTAPPQYLPGGGTTANPFYNHANQIAQKVGSIFTYTSPTNQQNLIDNDSLNYHSLRYYGDYPAGVWKTTSTPWNTQLNRGIGTAPFGRYDNVAIPIRIRNREVARFNTDSTLSMTKYRGLDSNNYAWWDPLLGKLSYKKFHTLYVDSNLTTGGAFIRGDTIFIPNKYGGSTGSGTVTNVTATYPMLITGTSTVTPNVVADTGRTNSALVTGGSLNKKSDSVYSVLNAAKLNIADTLLINAEIVQLRNGKQNTLNGTGYIKQSGTTTTYQSIIPVTDGGTGTATPSLLAGANVTITGAFPNQTINASGGGGLDTTKKYRNNLYGTLTKRNLFSNLNNFVDNGSGATVSSGNIIFPTNSAGTYTKSLDLKLLNNNDSGYTSTERFKFSDTFIVREKSATSIGVGAGMRSYSSGTLISMLGLIDISTGATSGKVKWYDGYNGIVANSVSALSFSVNDTIVLNVEQDIDSGYVSAFNQTTKSAPVSVTGYAFHNTGRFALFSIGGAFDVTGIGVISREPQRIEVLLVGDSKIRSNGTGNYATSIAGYLQQTFPSLAVSAGSSDWSGDVLKRVQEIITLKPRQVILEIGYNDVANSVSTATWQANISSIISQLQAAGIRVYLINPYSAAGSGTYTATLDAYFQTNYSSIYLRDSYSQTKNIPNVLQPDGTHLNEFGAKIEAAAIVGQMALTDGFPNNTANYLLYNGGRGIKIAGTNIVSDTTVNLTWVNGLGLQNPAPLYFYNTIGNNRGLKLQNKSSIDSFPSLQLTPISGVNEALSLLLYPNGTGIPQGVADSIRSQIGVSNVDTSQTTQAGVLRATGSAYGLISSNGNPLPWYIDATGASSKTNANAVFATNGNTGFGTISPTFKVHVNGNFYVTSTARFDGNFSFSGTAGTNTQIPQSQAGIMGWTTPASIVSAGIGSFTAGSVLYWNGSSVAQDNANLFWDATNHRLGIGTTSPSQPLTVNYTQNTSNSPGVVFTNAGTGNSSGLLVNSTSTGNPNIALGVSGSVKIPFSYNISSGAGAFGNFNYSTNDFIFFINSDGSLQMKDPQNSSASRWKVSAAGTMTLPTVPTINTETSPQILVRNATSGNIEQRSIASTNGIYRISQTTGINAFTVANTLAYTNATGADLIITSAEVFPTAASGVTSGPAIGIGRTAGTSDIFASNTLTALQTTSDVYGWTLTGMSKKVANGQTIYINLGTSAAGTSETVTVNIYGHN